MIKHFAKKVDYTIPESLKCLVLEIISGESINEVDLTIPIFATGFPLMVNIYGEKPTYTVNDHPFKTRSNLVMAGQIYNSRLIFRQIGKFGNLRLILHPTAPYYLLHKSGKYFNNKWTRLKDAAPQPCCSLINKLSHCTSPAKRIEHILEYLIKLEEKRLPEITWLERSLEKILLNNGIVSQEELIKDAGVSLRHFRRVFKSVIGVPPKYYCKVIQLNTVFQLLNDSTTEKMHHLALDCGYYDQAHFIKDFNRIMGDTPRHFLQGKHAYIKTYMGMPGN